MRVLTKAENHQGVLSRIAGLFSGRGYNLESITAGITTDPSVTRLTLVCKGDALIVDQIKKQLNKLIDIIKVVDLSEKPSLKKCETAPQSGIEIDYLTIIFLYVTD
jgi:acetolactate synthase-1/3 small subunit